jgi:hypothetical protein
LEKPFAFIIKNLSALSELSGETLSALNPEKKSANIIANLRHQRSKAFALLFTITDSLLTIHYSRFPLLTQKNP